MMVLVSLMEAQDSTSGPLLQQRMNVRPAAVVVQKVTLLQRLCEAGIELNQNPLAAKDPLWDGNGCNRAGNA